MDFFKKVKVYFIEYTLDNVTILISKKERENMDNMLELYNKLKTINESNDDEAYEALKAEMLPLLTCHKSYSFSPCNDYREAMHLDADMDTLESNSVSEANDVEFQDIRDDISQFLTELIEENQNRWASAPWSY